MNLLKIYIVHNSYHYCFCNKYHSCELDYNQGRLLHPLCQIPVYLNNFEEYLDRAQFDLFKLKQFGFKLYPMLLECYVYDKRSLESFSGHFYYSPTDRYTGQKKRKFIETSN